MRINTTSRTGSVTGRAGVSRAGSGDFTLPEENAPVAGNAAAPVSAMGGIEALLALQAVDDPLFARKKSVRRGNQLLDTLESLKADLLVGRISEGKLNHLMMLLGQARERTPGGLDAVLDDIELRVRVELAKLGKFPGTSAR